MQGAPSGAPRLTGPRGTRAARYDRRLHPHPSSAPAAGGYLGLLRPQDLLLLARTGQMAERDAVAVARRLAAEPETLDRVLAAKATADAVLGPPKPPTGAGGAGAGEAEPLLGISPALMFAVALERTRADLAQARSVREWTGPRQRLPVLGTAGLCAFLAEPAHRGFLVELLASFTRVASGSVWRNTSRGRRRQRFSELDPVRLATVLSDLPQSRRPQMQRRLGDVSLFLTGVFPDHTAARAFRPIDLARLGRAAAVPGAGDELAEALELRGGVGLLELLGSRWYRLAAPALGAGASRLVASMGERFVEARRALNQISDRHLFRVHDELLGSP